MGMQVKLWIKTCQFLWALKTSGVLLEWLVTIIWTDLTDSDF